MYSILPRMAPKWLPNDPNSTLWLWSSTTGHYLGAIRTILGEEGVETSPKVLILRTDIALLLTFNSYNLTWFGPFSPSSTSFENYKARPTFLDHFWMPELPNQTQNLTGKGVTLCCHNCILSEFTNVLPDNLRGYLWPNLLYRSSFNISMSSLSVLTNQIWTITYIVGFLICILKTKDSLPM